MPAVTAAAPLAPRDTEQRFLDAAERLLVSEGYAAITTRRLAEEAGANVGLVHYYFGPMEELFAQVLERFTNRLVERQRRMYAAPGRYLDKWREAMRYLELDRPYQKVWWELQAMAWNRPEFRPRVARVLEAWSDAMRDAVAGALKRYGLKPGPFSVDAWVTLIVTVNEGIILERLSGIERGHAELLASIDRWLETLERRAARRPGAKARSGRGKRSRARA